jgi:hypothetical protein
MALALGSSALVAGCVGSGRAGYAVSASYSQPDLAYVSPGVYVVADYNEPVFYTDNSYWRFHNGYWYRSNYYDRGFTYYQRPPRAVLSIDRPYAYVRYRPQHGDRYQATRQGGVRVRDHRHGGYYRY